MKENLILPTSITQHQREECTLDKIEFSDGSVVSELRSGEDSTMYIVNDGEGTLRMYLG